MASHMSLMRNIAAILASYLYISSPITHRDPLFSISSREPIEWQYIVS